MVFNLSDFNLASVTTIYGYSLFGFDVTDAGESNDLISLVSSCSLNGKTGSTRSG